MILEVEGKMEEVQSMSSLPSNEFGTNTLGRIQEMYPIFHGKLNCRFYPIFYCYYQIFISAGEIGH